ncbi:hypothetical protein HF851_02035 [Corynebacterium ammoniagenes]|uniref:hypothetical protein n=1 Tax=Corynebacterium ammoniagenes TaxID=1697 RepID=UPI001459585D|nr:hypothetical protein [Corynebacterium ammoniagenes]NMF31055.1 hypothetical protein [Corynebacterium ammoniagenes]
MAENYRDTAGFVELLKMRRTTISPEVAPWTRDLVELLIINGEVALEEGKELSVEQMMTTLISTLMRVEETARHGGVPPQDKVAPKDPNTQED